MEATAGSRLRPTTCSNSLESHTALQASVERVSRTGLSEGSRRRIAGRHDPVDDGSKMGGAGRLKLVALGC